MTAPDSRLDKNDVLDRVDVAAFYAAHLDGFKVNGTAANVKVRCPWCDDANGLSVCVNGKKPGTWNCHHCKETGDVFSFLHLQQGMAFRDALSYVAEGSWSSPSPVARPKLVPYKPPPDLADRVEQWSRGLTAGHEAYLRKQRGISAEVVAAHGLGHDGERYTIPVRDRNGDVVLVKRYLPGGKPKMFCEPTGAGARLFGDHLLDRLDDGELVLVCEGEPDVMACQSLGYAAVSSTAGAECWQEAWTERLKRFAVVVIGDNDDKGRLMNEAVSKPLAEAGATVSVLQWPEDAPDGYDSTDCIVRQGISVFEDLVEAARAKAEEATTQSERQAIKTTDRLGDLVQQAIGAIGDHPELGIYCRGNTLVRVVHDQADRLKWLIRPAGSPTMALVEAPWLREQLDYASEWLKPKMKDGEVSDWVATQPPATIANHLVGRMEWDLRSLEGISECPLFLPHGEILSRPGYDANTGLLLLPGKVRFPEVPHEPSESDVRGAWQALLDPLCDFPFVSDTDKSVVLAALLSVMARSAYTGPAPGFAFRSPTPGTGKSMLADLVSLIATGRVAPRMSPPKEDDEARKRILAIAIEGEATVLIDNVSRRFGSEAIAAALTATTWKDRLLGASRTITAPLRAIWMITGNNLQFRGDLGRRMIPCDIDSSEEFPEDRGGFKYPDLLKHVDAVRPQLVTAALTILRGFHVAGRPGHGLPSKGSYKDWDDLVRASLIWAGVPDPLETTARVREEGDVERDALAAGLAVLDEMFDGGEFTASEALEQAAGNTERLTALAEFSGKDTNHLSGPAIGYALRNFRGRPYRGQRLEQSGKKSKRGVRWIIVTLEDPEMPAFLNIEEEE